MRIIALGLCLLAGGCASAVPYEPKETVLEDVAPEEARSRLEAIVLRSAAPTVTSVDVGAEQLAYRYEHIIRSAFGVPSGTVERSRELPWVSIRRVEVFDDHTVDVRGDRLMARLRFHTAADATGFADLVMSFRSRRLYGERRAEPSSADLIR